MSEELIDRLEKMALDGASRVEQHALGIEAAKELKRLQQYAAFTYFVANDYFELSYEKAQWQQRDWKKRAEQTIKDVHNDRCTIS